MLQGRRSQVRRSSAPTMPESLAAEVVSGPGTAGELLVAHHTSPIRIRRGLRVELSPAAFTEQSAGAAGELLLAHRNTPLSSRRCVQLPSLSETMKMSPNGAVGELYVPHHTTPIAARRLSADPNLQLPAELVAEFAAGGGAAGEIVEAPSTEQHASPLAARRGCVPLVLPALCEDPMSCGGGSAGELRRLVKVTSELGQRRGFSVSLPTPEELRDEHENPLHGAAGELYVPSESPSGSAPSPTPADPTPPPAAVVDRSPLGATGERSADAAVEELRGRPIDRQVDQIVTALLREHLAVYGGAPPYSAVRDAFEAAVPRTSDSVTRRSVLSTALGLPQDSSASVHRSILARVVAAVLAMGGLTAIRFETALQGDSTEPPPVAEPCPAEDIVTSSPFDEVAESSLCFNITDDGSGVAVNGLNVTDRTTSNMFRVKNLAELDLADAQLIGRGAGGRVLRVTHVPSGEQLAVKEIFIGCSANTAKQVQAEVSVLWGTTNRHKTHVPSPYLVNSQGIFYRDGSLYIAMELMDGSLNDALDVHGPFNEEQVQAMVFQILHGLHYMHNEKKQLHRDIKPHNILYNKDGWVKLSDFGIASDRLQTVQKIAAQTFCGTLVYMSPNRAEGLSYSFEGDMWSLGITVYQLVTGRLPTGNSIFEVLQLREHPPRLPKAPPLTFPPTHRSSYSAAFEAFMDMCLDPNATAACTCTTRDLLLSDWLRDTTLAKSQKVMQGVAREIMTRTQRQAAEPNRNSGFGQRDDLFATLDEALA